MKHAHALRYGALLLGASACQSVLGLDRGTPMSEGSAGGGAGGRGGRGGRGGGAGDEASSMTGGSAGDHGVLNSAGKGGTSGGSAGRPAETSADSGRGGSSGKASSGTGGEPLTGESGQGGEAGADPGECRRNEDCPNPDPDCRVECQSSAFGNTCVLAGPVDQDGDHHGTTACEAMPGDDCDDTRATVYEGAPELCDALDNDCDGKRDFDEHWMVSRVPVKLADAPTYDVDISWSPSQLTWGVLWSTASATKYQPVDPTGTPRIDAVQVSDFLGTYGFGAPEDEVARAVLPSVAPGHTIAISWGEATAGTGAFAVAFPGPGWDAELGLISADGASLVPAIPLTDTPGGWGSDSPDVEWLESQGVWAATWTDLRDNTFEPIVRTVSPTGSYGPEAYPGFGSGPRLAVAGGQLATVWSGFDTLHGSLLSQTLVATSLDIAGQLVLSEPYFAAQTDRFGVVFRALPDKFGYAELGLDGTVLCGPVLQEANGFVYSDLVPFADGFLILSGQPTVRALEALRGCHFGGTIELDSEPARFVRGASAGADGMFFAWGGQDQPLEMRVVGPHLCD